VEVFSAQEKSPLAHWNVSGIKKVKTLCLNCSSLLLCGYFVFIVGWVMM